MNFYTINRTKVRCPRCNEKMVPAISIRGTYSDFWLRCSDPHCQTFYDTFIPMPYQADIMKDSHRRIGVFGGYGSGKTVTTYKSDEKHIQITPNGETLIGANTLIQLENTVKKDLENDMPAEFVKQYNRQKNSIEFVNGHILYYRPLETEGDIRSYNLTRAHILEASEVKYESFVQLQARVRNEAAVKPLLDENGQKQFQWNKTKKAFEMLVDFDWLQIILESNPDSGWILGDFLLKSTEITIYDDENTNYNVLPTAVQPNSTSYIIPTRANYNLPPHFYEDLAADKPDWWKRRYLEGSFEYQEGLVYPNFSRAVIPSFKIPAHWPIIIAFDYGLNDNSCFIFGAVDYNGEKFGRPAVFFFREIVKNNMNIAELAAEYKRHYNEIVRPGALHSVPVMDAKSYSVRSREGEKKTLATLFQEQGCIFNKAQMNKDARILRLNTLIDLGNAYFFSDAVPYTIGEFSVYKYPERTLEKVQKNVKPVDGNDHCISAVEFAIMELPPRLENNNRPVTRVDDVLTNRTRQYNPLFDTEPQTQTDDYEGFAAAFRY